MPCYSPLAGRLDEDGRFRLSKKGALDSPELDAIAGRIRVSCGQCKGCRLEYSRHWASRIMHEVKVAGGVGSFVTLTF